MDALLMQTNVVSRGEINIFSSRLLNLFLAGMFFSKKANSYFLFTCMEVLRQSALCSRGGQFYLLPMNFVCLSAVVNNHKTVTILKVLVSGHIHF